MNTKRWLQFYPIPCNSFFEKSKLSEGLVAHTCIPSYSGGRDQEDLGSKPAWANSLRDPISKKTLHKKGLVEWFKL
jgi:hypothetical protein